MTRELPHHGRWFEELAVGDVILHALTRTVTETDNVLMTTLTLNPARLHLDAEYSAETEFGRPLVNSMFTLALLVGMSVLETTHGTTVANLGFEEVTFPAPVFCGDTLHAETEVVAARASGSSTSPSTLKLGSVLRQTRSRPSPRLGACSTRPYLASSRRW